MIVEFGLGGAMQNNKCMASAVRAIMYETPEVKNGVGCQILCDIYNYGVLGLGGALFCLTTANVAM
eukprot:7570255-Lingulodinium_polyedra.AAC.1